MKPKVVIVDDEPAIVEAVCDVLDDADVSAVACPHGRKVHACIQKMQPALVILDVQMPGVDGIQLFRQLREDPSLAETAVLFLTANREIVDQALPDYTGRGATLIAKPFQVQDLVGQIMKVLARPSVLPAPASSTHPEPS